MTRLRLFQIRLAATGGLMLLLVAVVRLLWFPGAYSAIFGVSRLLLLIAVIALIIGPVLSVVVYKPGKKGLKLDLVVLTSLEIAAVAFGAWQLYARQPFYAVLAVDRFEAVSRAEIDASQIVEPTLLTRPGHAPRLVYAELPNDPVAVDRLIDETLFEGKQDIDRRPEFWRPYTAGVPHLKAVARPLGFMLSEESERGKRARRWLARNGGGAGDFIFVPLRGPNRDAAMILHADVGFPVGTLDVDPW